MKPAIASSISIIVGGISGASGGTVPVGITPESLPIREVTVFKDGSAMILRRGEAPTDANGDIAFGDLPHPILGTFWAWEDEPNADLLSVRASRDSSVRSRPPENLCEMIQASVGATILWGDSPAQIHAVVSSTPEPTSVTTHNAWPRVSRPVGPPSPTEQTVLLRLQRGEILAVPMSALLQEITFIDSDPSKEPFEEIVETDQLSMDLDWKRPVPERAQVGMMYVERGLRWIPTYKLTILDDQTVRLELQATLINEITDLEDVTVNLVVGVPSFAFENTPDPIGLQDFFADLGPYFRKGTSTASALSNSIMTQHARMTESRSTASPWGDGEAFDLGSTDREEDLFIFTVHGIVLGAGERAVIPLESVELPYERVYTLDLPVAPPQGLASSLRADQQRRIAEMLDRPGVRQVLRIKNTSRTPITTAPALIIRDGYPLAQDLMTYTSAGASTDIEVTTAVDVRVDLDERVVSRNPNAIKLDGHSYTKIDTEGAITLMSYKAEPITVEVNRRVLGIVDSAGQAGEATEHSVFSRGFGRAVGRDAWWLDYSWPFWWTRLNGAWMIRWDVELQPGHPTTLDWSAHYFAR